MENIKCLAFTGLAIILLASCSSSNKAGSSSASIAVPPAPKEYLKITKDSMRSIMAKACPDMGYEFTDLYASPQSLPDEDVLVLAGQLKNKGFSAINTGRGNWDRGPRIVTITLETANCICDISKRYYNTEGTTDKYRVTETLDCHKR